MVSILCENIELWVAYKSNQRKKSSNTKCGIWAKDTTFSVVRGDKLILTLWTFVLLGWEKWVLFSFVSKCFFSSEELGPTLELLEGREFGGIISLIKT